MENQPYVFCGRREKHLQHGTTCPGTGTCGNRFAHDEHLVLEGSLAPFWCAGQRRRLYREGTPTNDGRMLKSSWWDANSSFPVTARPEGPGHAGAAIVGRVTDLRKEADGWVTGVIDARGCNGLMPHAEFDSMQWEKQTDDDQLVASSARFRSICMIEGGSNWEGAEAL